MLLPDSGRTLQAPPNYRLLEKIGGGGCGTVWRAEGPGEIVVALKYIPIRGIVAVMEAQSLEYLKRVRHPHLLTPFAAWRLVDHLVIGMDLADSSLHDRLEEARALGLGGIPLDELDRWMSQIAEGITHLNEHRHDRGNGMRVGIQHGDLKPRNILIVGGGVRVADLGLAHLLDRSAASHDGGYTPSYAAPECFSGKTSDRSDQYSLAVTFCELRGGRLPFVGSPQQVMHAHLYDPPDLSMISPRERAVVARALSKLPHDRWPDCRKFVAELRASRSPAVDATMRNGIVWGSVNGITTDSPLSSSGDRSAGEPRTRTQASAERSSQVRVTGGSEKSGSSSGHERQIRPARKNAKARYESIAVLAILAVLVVLPGCIIPAIVASIVVPASLTDEAMPLERNPSRSAIADQPNRVKDDKNPSAVVSQSAWSIFNALNIFKKGGDAPATEDLKQDSRSIFNSINIRGR